MSNHRMREQGDAPNPHPLALELRSIRPPIFTAFPVHLDRQRLRAGNRGRSPKISALPYLLEVVPLAEPGAGGLYMW